MSSILTLIFMLILGSGLAYLALENSTPVTLTLLGQQFPDIPLFIIIAACILIGLVLALLLNISNTLSTLLSLHKKDRLIKDLQAQISDLKPTSSSLPDSTPAPLPPKVPKGLKAHKSQSPPA